MPFNLGLALKTLGRVGGLKRSIPALPSSIPHTVQLTLTAESFRLIRNVQAATADYRVAVKLDRKDKTARDNLRSIETALRKIGAGKTGIGAKAKPLR